MRTRQEFFSVADLESIASWPFASRLGGLLAAAADVKSSSHTEGRCCAKRCASVPYWHPRVVMDLIQVSESEVEVRASIGRSLSRLGFIGDLSGPFLSLGLRAGSHNRVSTLVSSLTPVQMAAGLARMNRSNVDQSRFCTRRCPVWKREVKLGVPLD